MPILAVLIATYVPGALLFRIPTAGRPLRAALPAEERLFWAVILSGALSSLVALALAAGGWYDLRRVLWTDAGTAIVVAAIYRGRLRFNTPSPPPSWTAAVPAALIVAAAAVFYIVPPSEYIMGGKDPGVYLTEGIRIAQRGAVVVEDDVVRSVPEPFRDLFFPKGTEAGYHSSRFMGYYLLDADTGSVVGQFPVGFPVWVAFGYAVNGLSGARTVPVMCALLGVVAVYFCGVRLFGRAAAAAGAALLTANVAQVWYSRYPSAEVLLQPLVFAGVLAYLRAVHDNDRFFAPVSAVLFTIGAFTHLTGALVAATVGAAALFEAVSCSRRVPWTFWVVLVTGTAVSSIFLWRYIPPYFETPVGFVNNLRTIHYLFALATVALGGGGLIVLRRLDALTRDRIVGVCLTLLLWVLAAYACFVRQAGGDLALHDADSLRTFTSIYLTPIGLAAALTGFAIAARTLGHTAAFLALVSAFSIAFFYKIRIVPEHFWAARRFLAVILPGALLLVGAAALADLRVRPTGREPGSNRIDWLRIVRYTAGVLALAAIGWQFVVATRPILRHVEYAGLIPRVEELASTFGDDDLVLFESRGASDSHVLALPLAYVYARQVLVFARTDPSKEIFREFLSWALTKYRRVFFVGGGGGGTELLSNSITVDSVRGERFQIPEYESALNASPRGVRQKEFDLGVYEFLAHPTPRDRFDLDIGSADDLYVRRFYAKERSSGDFTMRWTRDESFISLLGVRPGHRLLTMWMDSGGRPQGADPAEVTVFLQDQLLGSATVGEGVRAYEFAVPAELAEALARSDNAAVLRIATRTWSPARLLGGGDTRELGVMLDRVEVR